MSAHRVWERSIYAASETGDQVCNTLITSSNLVVASEESSKDGSFFFVLQEFSEFQLFD